MQHSRSSFGSLYNILLYALPLSVASHRSTGSPPVSCTQAGGLNVALTLPVQPEQELGPFWVTTGCCGSLERTQAAEADCSLGSWGVHQHSSSLSLSLMMQQTLSG